MQKIILFLFLFCSFVFGQSNTLEIGFVYWKKVKSPQKYNAYLYGINKAINDYKTNGGYLDIKVVPFNEKGDIKESIKIAKDIAKRDNMIAVIGFSNSKRAISSIKYVSEQNIPIISSAGSIKVFESDVNHVFYTTNFGIKGEIQYLEKFIQSRLYKDIIFISKKGDKYSKEYFNEVSKIITKSQNIFLSDVQKFDFNKHINEKTLIIISIDVPQNATISKLLRDKGIQNDIFLGRGGIVGGEFYENGGYGLKNVYELSTLLAGVSNETLLEFKANNQDFFQDKKNAEYLEYVAYGYDAVNLVLEAYNRAKLKSDKNPKIIRETIKKGLSLINEKDSYDGIATSYSFDKDRIGGKLTPQYILQSTGKKPTLYKKQYIYQNGVLGYVPALYTNIDIKSISIKNQEASEYSLEIMLTLVSERDIGIDDIEFENIIISDSSFNPSIYSKEFIVSKQEGSNDLKTKIYNVKALFGADNSIEDFPFDSQKIPILIKPKNPLDENFINLFISDFDKNLKHITISGWKIKSGYAGFKKGSYEHIGANFEKNKEYYYRSSFTLEIERRALSSAVKFILPLVIVLFISLILFIMPDNAIGDKIGASTNMLITVAALYFTYATLVDVDYLTYVDWLYMGSLAFVLLANSIFIFGQKYYVDKVEIKKSYKSLYNLSFAVSIIAFLSVIIYFLKKSNF